MLVTKKFYRPKDIKKEPTKNDVAHSCHTTDCTPLAGSRYYRYKRELSQNSAPAELNRRKFTVLTSE